MLDSIEFVVTVGETWDESVGDELWDLTHTVAGGNKNLMAKVKSQTFVISSNSEFSNKD